MSPDDLRKIEELAVELARLAGAEIIDALGKSLAIRYKGDEASGTGWRDPVSEVDHRVEQLIRARLSGRFPLHGIIGEEMEEQPSRESGFVWAIDPIDGTTNFINGFPLFAASIGVLQRGRPVVGAVWCSVTHALRPGTYHACEGGTLRFDEEPIPRVDRNAVRRPLAGEPEASRGEGLPWDVRKTGSAAIEAAFVAAGLLRVARFEHPNLWDVAGGIPLVLATGGEVRARDDGRWNLFDSFDSSGAEGGTKREMRHWRKPMVLGETSAVSMLCEAQQDR